MGNVHTDLCETFCYEAEKVERVKKTLATEQDSFLPTSTIFKALSDETRLKVAFSLIQEQELCVCDVSHIIGSSLATASHHLRQLKNAGIAKRKKRGKLVFYSIQNPQVISLITHLLNHNKSLI